MIDMKILKQVHKELEYIGYPDIVLEFSAEDVARSMLNAIVSLQDIWSPRRIACFIFGCTMVYQVIPLRKGEKIH